MKLNLSLTVLKKRLIDFRLSILLLCILILGAGLRFYKIDERHLYCDEVLTVQIISESSIHNIWKNVTENFPSDLPFFYVLLHIWKTFGESLFWLRTLSALSGLLLILVAYKLAKYLFDINTALLTAYLVSISPLLVLYSQTFRYYSLNSLLNLVSLYIFIKAVHGNRISNWFFYALLMVISIYISYGSFLFLFFEGIFIIAYKKKYPLSFKRWLFCCAVIFLAYLPLIQYLFRDFNLLLKGDGVKRIPLRSGWIGALAYFFFSFSLGQTISPFNYPVVIVAAIIYLFILINFFRVFLSQRISRESAIFIMSSLFIIIVLCAFSNYNSPRYIKATYVMYAAIIAVAILNMPRKLAVISIIMVSLLNFYSLSNLYNKRQYHNMEFVDNWNAVASYVDSQSGSDDIIIYNNNVFGYYLNNINNKKLTYAMPEDINVMHEFIAENLENRRFSTLIFVDSPLSGNEIADYKDEIGLLQGWLKKNNFNLLSVRGFDKDSEAAIKRKYINRPFPEYRTTVYIYSKK